MKGNFLRLSEGDPSVHFQGGFVADTQTLCGMTGIFNTPTEEGFVTCAACDEIIETVFAAYDTEDEDLAPVELAFTCPKCGAGPGALCHAVASWSSGHRTNAAFHKARKELAK